MAAADPLDDLRRNLQAAVEIELMVIPPYLTALYSLHPGSNREAELIIRSVVVEEMLHLVLAANVLNAVGGRPRLPVPAYPHQLFDFSIALLPFGRDAIETFLKIEKPSYPLARSAAAAAAEGAPALAMRLGYTSIGEFYEATLRQLEQLVAERGEQAVFCGDRARQVGPEQYYGAGGAVRRVHSLDDARLAIAEIVEQGEGEAMPPPGEDEKFDADLDLAHYYRFYELSAGRRFRVDDRPDQPTGPEIDVDFLKVYPVAAQPRPDEWPAEVRERAAAFDAVWCALLAQVEDAFDGRPERLRDAVVTMFDLKYAAQGLMRIPLGDGTNAGPLFRAVSGSPPAAPSPEATASRG